MDVAADEADNTATEIFIDQLILAGWWCPHPSLVELFHFRKLLLEMLQQVLVVLPGEASQQCSRNVFTHCTPLETVLANLFCYTKNYTTKIV